MKPGDDVGEVILELGDIHTPDATDDAASAVADGSDIHSVNGPMVTRAVPHDIEAVLLAYLLELDVPPMAPETQSRPQESTAESVGGESEEPT